MIKWLKFYFLGFFNDKYNKEAANRSIGNVLLSLIFYFLIMTTCISIGFNNSFTTHYNKASQFNEFTTNLFANEDLSQRIIVKVDTSRKAENKSIVATLNGSTDDVVINSYEVEADQKYEKNGYKIIIDTRDSTTSYVDFELIFYKTDDEKDTISYEDYKSSSNQSDYSYKFVFNDKTDNDPSNDLVKILSIDDIKTILETVNTSTTLNAYGWLDEKTKDADDSSTLKTSWDEIKQLDNTSNEYFLKTYDLYIKNYYGLTTTPSIVSYYQNTYAVTDENGNFKYKNYLILTDTWCCCSYTNDKDVVMTFDGFYDDLGDDFVLSDNTLTINKIQDNTSDFLLSVYQSVSSIKVLYTIVSLFRFLPVLLIAILVMGLIIFGICKIKKRSYGEKLFGGFKIVSNYLFMSSLIGGLISFILCFVVSNEFAYAFGCYGLIAIIALRTLIFVIMQEIRLTKNPDLEPVSSSTTYSTSSPLGNNLKLSNVDMGNKVFINDNVNDDEDETMELM